MTVGSKYPPLKKLEHESGQVASQTKRRKEWEAEMNASRIARKRLQPLLPLQRK